MTKTTRRLSGIQGTLPALALTVIYFALMGNVAVAATLPAKSCELVDVQAAVNAASSGDTVRVPAGNCTWSGTLDLASGGASTYKFLTLEGAGTDETIVVDNVLKGPTGIPYLIWWNVVPGGPTRITGFTFRNAGQPDNTGGSCSMLVFGGDTREFRFDHNQVTSGIQSSLCLGRNITGVIDHNFFDLSSGAAMNLSHITWDNVGDYGDSSWAAPSTLGTARAMFIEDNTFSNNGSTSWFKYTANIGGGARVVVRHNTFVNNVLAFAGTQHRYRGTRQFEIYSNLFQFDLKGNTLGTAMTIAAGTGVVFDNHVDARNGTAGVAFQVTHYRSYQDVFAFGLCDGGNAWDENGDATGHLCLDQVGAGSGDLLNALQPINTALGDAGWPRQTADPVYAWNNFLNDAGSAPISAFPAQVLIGRDVIEAAKPGYLPFPYPHPLATPPDSGTPDGGAEPITHFRVTCGCNTGSDYSALLLLAVLMLRRRRYAVSTMTTKASSGSITRQPQVALN